MNVSEDNLRRSALAKTAAGLGLLAFLACMAGCESAVRSPKVFFLDGAGYYGAHFSVHRGLERAGYLGAFERFAWSSWLGPGADHLVVARSRDKGRQLEVRIVGARRSYPRGKIYLMGLSAGTAVILSALEDLPQDVNVDGVVLFSSSVSSRRNLVPALKHVNGRLYATCSSQDTILSALVVNADGGPGRPAGLRGFLLPSGLREESKALYSKVVNVPWQPSYVGFGWHGGHVQATAAGFVENVIAPRLLSAEPYPLDRPVWDRMLSEERVTSESIWTHRCELKARALALDGAGGV